MSESLPEGFLWGNSVSSMQTEGAWDKDGKGKSVYDIREATKHASDWKVATDSYHRYEEDFDHMKDMGMNCYRFQISWSRVIPTGDGEINEEGLQFYDRFIDALLERGIEPMICLYHFDMPLHLAEEYDGFLSRHVVDAFERYGKLLVDRYKEKVKYWITFNEQNIFGMERAAFRIAGVTKAEYDEKKLYQIQHNTMVAHARIANYIHETAQNSEIGGMITYNPWYPASSKPADSFAAQLMDDFWNQVFLYTFTYGKYPAYFTTYLEDNGWTPEMEETDLEDIAQMKSDWLAFSYYASNVVDSDAIDEGAPISNYGQGKIDNPHLERTEWNWQIDPLAFRMMMRDMYARYNLPLFPIENGIGVIEDLPEDEFIEDDYRIDYHQKHLQAMKEAILLDGVECLGYLGWGLIDILSSQGDMRKRYGMVYVNRENHDLKDLRRIPKKSYYWMKQVTASNGANLENINTHSIKKN